MANLNNSIPQLPHTLHTSGSADSNHDNYDRSLLSDIDPSLKTQPIATSSRSTIWSGGNGLRWVPPSRIHKYLGF